MSRIQPGMLCLVINAPAGTAAEAQPQVTTVRRIKQGDYIKELSARYVEDCGEPVWLCEFDADSMTIIPDKNLMPIGGLKELEQQEQEVCA